MVDVEVIGCVCEVVFGDDGEECDYVGIVG